MSEPSISRPTEADLEALFRLVSLLSNGATVHKANALLGILRNIQGRKLWDQKNADYWVEYKRQLATLLGTANTKGGAL